MNLYPGSDGMVKKTISSYCPFKCRPWSKKTKISILRLENLFCFILTKISVTVWKKLLIKSNIWNGSDSEYHSILCSPFFSSQKNVVVGWITKRSNSNDNKNMIFFCRSIENINRGKFLPCSSRQCVFPLVCPKAVPSAVGRSASASLLPRGPPYKETLSRDFRLSI